MGFCRRCGDIVVGTRCKCGGTAVAPVLQWSSPNSRAVDKWSQTYISKDKSPVHTSIQIDDTLSASRSNAAQTGPAVRPDQSTPHPPAGRRYSLSRFAPPISGHTMPQISSVATLSKQPLAINNSSNSPSSPILEAGISHAQGAPELSKAFGSILQPKESLAPYSCAICLTEFQPDATIFPDPSVPESFDRYLCRPCFIVSGGSKGDCPSCRRPVLVLKSEGGFVETSGRVWHKKCFRCEGCQKNIGNTPMVDLFGKPSCADCFDTCLKRNSTPKRSHPLTSLEKVDHSTSATVPKDLGSQEGSPAIDELEQRLGIMKNREGSPVLEELAQRLNAVLNRTPRDSSPSIRSSTSKEQDNSPLAHHVSERKKAATVVSPRRTEPIDLKGSLGDARTATATQEIHTDGLHEDSALFRPRPSLDAVEEMKSRFLSQITSPVSFSDTISFPVSMPDSTLTKSPVPTPSRIPRIAGVSSPGLRHALSSSNLHTSRMTWMPSTPDLILDASDTLTQSSGPSSPRAFSPQARARDEFAALGHTPTKDMGLENRTSGTVTPKRRDSLSRSSIPTAVLSSGSLCAKCGGSLFVTGGSGRFVTVPECNSSGPPKTYHTECFRCALCDGPFRETANGQAVFVRGEGGACHIECAPAEKAQTKSTVAPNSVKSTFSDTTLSPPLAPLTNTIRTAPKQGGGTGHTQSLQGASHHGNNLYSSSRYERPSMSMSSISSPSSRFGSSSACPGCQKAVSPMEMGVVPGPQGSKWHAICLVCGGRGTGKGRRDKSQPGCGKRLDSAAKRDAQGGVWCRECLLLLPLHMRSSQIESSPRPLVPSYTGRSTGDRSSIAPQLTGTTTIARQFTGRGGDSGILRQLTGGPSSGARQLSGSPTKQLGLATPRPRPKSVIGMRSSKSIDEGRGMYLVRQMTGGGGSFGL